MAWKKSIEKRNREKEENVALKNKLDGYVKGFDKSFTEIEAMKDAAEKILKLQALAVRIAQAEKQIDKEITALVKYRAARTQKTYLKRTGLIVAAATMVGMPIAMESNWTAKGSLDEKTRELKAETGADNFKKTTADYLQRAGILLDTTVKTCDLKEIAQSPHFPDALHNCAPLKKKFDAAAVARAALGSDTPKGPQPKSGTGKLTFK